MSDAAHDTLMQAVGLTVLLGPMLALIVGLSIAFRRARAAERAEFAELPPQAD